jgi:hypothetical protein
MILQLICDASAYEVRRSTSLDCAQQRMSSCLSLVEKGSLVQDTKAICPGSVGKSGPMTGIGPGPCRLGAGPGSFRGIGPGLWHEPGPMPPQHGTWLSAEHWSRFMP